MFIKIGARLINADRINHVRQVLDTSGKLSFLRIFFTDGETIDVRDSDEIEALLAAIAPADKGGKK